MAPLCGASWDGSGLGRHSALPHPHVSEGLYIKTTDVSAHAHGAAGVSLPTQRRGSCSQLPFPGHNSHFPRIKNEPSTNTQHMLRGWHCPAARVALGPTVGRHSELGHEGSAAAPSCPWHRGEQSLAELGPHQQPEPGTMSIPACSRDAGLNHPAGPWQARGTPHTHKYQGDAQGACKGLDPTGWWVLLQSVSARLWACTHRQPLAVVHGLVRLSRAEAVVAEGLALVPVTPLSPGSRSPGAPGVFGRQETPPQSCHGHGEAFSLTQRRCVGVLGAHARGY